MRVLYITTSAITLRAFLRPFAAHFRKRGWRVDAAARQASTSPDCREAFDRLFDLPLARNPLALRDLLHAAPLIRRLAIEQDYDLVHVHTPIAGFLTRFALRSLRRRGRPKVIYTAHGFHFHPEGRFLPNLIFRTMEQWAGRWTDYLVVINRKDHAAALRYRIVPPERLRLFPGIGVDTQHYAPIPVDDERVRAVRTQLALDDHTPLFLMVAEFNPGKRHLDALEALARLDHRNAHLAFAGAGPLLAAMRDKAGTLGLGNRVHFLGFQPDIRPWIAASIATLLPSVREGLPRSTLESMSMGIPAVGTAIRGLEELLEGDGGFLVPVRNPAALAAAMDGICDNPARARVIGAKARARILSQYSLDHVLACHEALYDEALHRLARPDPV